MAQTTAAGIRANLEKALSAPGAEAAFEREAERFSSHLLDCNTLGGDEFSLICEVLSRPVFFHVKGAFDFVLPGIYQEIFSSAQMERLFAVIVENYPLYVDEELCWWAGDFIARRYPWLVALQAFEQLAPSIVRPTQQSGLLVGLDILRWHGESESAACLARRQVVYDDVCAKTF